MSYCPAARYCGKGLVMKRRQFLQTLAAGATLPLMYGQMLSASAAQPALQADAQPRLLVVFLRGGYDAASLLVPVNSTMYGETRPNIAIPRPGTAAGAALALTGDWGLHPALQDTIFPMFGRGQAAFIPFAGTDDLSRSHFETQDSMELGQPLQGRRDVNSGFLNRLAEVLNQNTHAVSAMAFTEQLPLIMQGRQQIANTALNSTGSTGLNDRQSKLIASMYQGQSLHTAVDEGFAVRDQVNRQLNQMQAEDKAAEMAAANRRAISTKGFGLEARRIGKLMQQYSLGFVDVGGWDTHVNQGATTGALANKFSELGTGLAAFSQEMGASWNNTVVVVISEFGRTFRENGNRGTDHGHGSVFWVLGGGLHGGKVPGEQIRLEQGNLFQGRDYPVLNEYRSVLGGLFSRMYGLSSAQTDKVFPGVKVKDMGLL